MKAINTLVFIFILFLSFLSGCVPSMNYLVRFDINKDEIDVLYKNMPEKEVFELLGLPHRPTIYFDTSSYDYVNEDGILRVDFNYHKLDSATYFGKDDANIIHLKEDKITEIDSDKYLREIKRNISADDLEFINSNTNADELQTGLGPPHKIVEYELDGFLLNSFAYNLSDGNNLYIIYKQDGIVGKAWIETKDGQTYKEIVKIAGMRFLLSK